MNEEVLINNINCTKYEHYVGHVMSLHYVYKQQLTSILLFLKDHTIIKLQLLIPKMLTYTYFFWHQQSHVCRSGT
jgi:hypothetical protein